jgi:hypothetical protein
VNKRVKEDGKEKRKMERKESKVGSGWAMKIEKGLLRDVSLIPGRSGINYPSGEPHILPPPP